MTIAEPADAKYWSADRVSILGTWLIRPLTAWRLEVPCLAKLVRKQRILFSSGMTGMLPDFAAWRLTHAARVMVGAS